ncbi:endonuclease domain-containing protein [Micromonospora sp. SD12]|uniref:endonuclease domain-containing protein n=1 Tax=Micromonospora sp. SD12 TaxID=3452216 RepID=UPI003F8A309A
MGRRPAGPGRAGHRPAAARRTDAPPPASPGDPIRGAGFRPYALRRPARHHRVDLAWPTLRVAVEYDGDHHRERAHFRQDVARLDALRAAGWIVLRFTADDVLRHRARTAALVSQALRERHTSA